MSDQSKKFISRVCLPFIVCAIFCITIILVIAAPKRISSNQTLRHVIHDSESMTTNQTLQQVMQDTDEVEGSDDSALVPPHNFTKQQRIDWFRKNLHRFDILKPNSLTKEFHHRVVSFMNQRCEVQVYMIWIAPAKLFRYREIVATESLFKAHPKGCLVILSKTLDSKIGYNILKPLLDHKFKILPVSPDLANLLEKTPAEDWFEEVKKGKIDPGCYSFAQHLSNLMRYAILYKYGGIYIDTDMIIVKSFKGLKNSVGAQSIDPVTKKWSRLNNAVMIFDKKHPLMFKFMEDYVKNFDGNKWGHNGPYLVSRVVERVGGEPDYKFTILPPKKFYPLLWKKIEESFMKPKTRIQIRWTEAMLCQIEKESYAVHLWSKISRQLKIEKGSLIYRLMLKHCVICKLENPDYKIPHNSTSNSDDNTE